MVEKSFLLKIIHAINFRGFHCPRNFFNNKLFSDYSTFILATYIHSGEKDVQVKVSNLSYVTEEFRELCTTLYYFNKTPSGSQSDGMVFKPDACMFS